MAPISRKTFLQRSTLLGAGFCAASLVPACSFFDDPEMLVCMLSDLEGKDFLISRFNGRKIFVTHLDAELTIFSMICRHKRCTVKYEEFTREFACPCHEGRYDQYGRVLDGPPPGPLYRFKTEIRGEELWVLNEYR